MMTLQNLDVHGTFGVHLSKLSILFNINALAVNKIGYRDLCGIGQPYEFTCYPSDLHRYSRPEYDQASMARGLFINGDFSTACQQEETQ